MCSPTEPRVWGLSPFKCATENGGQRVAVFCRSGAASTYIVLHVCTMVEPMKTSTILRVAATLIIVMAGCSNGVATNLSPAPSTSTSIPRTTTSTTAASIGRVPEDWEVVYADIWDAYLAAQGGETFPIEHVMSPTVDREKATEAIVAYERALKPWLASMGGSAVTPIVWVIMSERDYKWWYQFVTEQEGLDAGYNWDSDKDMLGHCKLTTRSFCGYTKPLRPGTPEYRILQYSVIGSEYTDLPNANTVNHEATHWYQFSVTGRFPADVPCWYIEGQASLYGGALQYDVMAQRGSSVGQRNNFKGIVRQYQPGADEFDVNQWVEVLESMYQPHVSCGPTQDYFKYALGMFNWESLQATYGFVPMHQVLLDFADGATFASSVHERLGITVEDLNELLARHLVHVFAEGH